MSPPENIQFSVNQNFILFAQIERGRNRKSWRVGGEKGEQNLNPIISGEGDRAYEMG